MYIILFALIYTEINCLQDIYIKNTSPPQLFLRFYDKDERHVITKWDIIPIYSKHGDFALRSTKSYYTH